MEKEDRVIRDLLLKTQREKAPAGFTDRVMDRLEAAAEQKQTVPSDWLYWLVVAGSILIAGSILSVIDPSLIPRYFRLFTGFISGFFHQMTGLFKHLPGPGGDQLVMGTFLIILILLLADRLLWGRRKQANLFLWI